MLQNFRVAEQTVGPRNTLLLLRIALVIVFLWFGCMKFTHYEATGNSGLIANSPFMSWMNTAFGIQGASEIARPHPLREVAKGWQTALLRRFRRFDSFTFRCMCPTPFQKRSYLHGQTHEDCANAPSGE